jgi:uncharacterized protein with von Willebrand factor type A (vWA) domain
MGAAAGLPPGPSTLEAPYDRLADLPRAVWLPALITSAGERAARLVDTGRWLACLHLGQLPPQDADFGDAAATEPLRQAVGELGLPQLSRGVPALAEQVLRTLLWHLDRINNLLPRLARTEAIHTVAQAFRAEWQLETQGLQEDLKLLLALGDTTSLSWGSLRGALRSRPWQQVQAAAQRLALLPELAALIQRLGRSERSVDAQAAAATTPEAGPAPPVPLRAVRTLLPDTPGEITGVRFSQRLEHMLGSEAVMLRHPVLKKLWRARHAEARLLSWEMQADLTDWRVDPAAAPQAQMRAAPPEPLQRGPMLLCLDTSGSMRGAPELIAKAVVMAALQAAHAAGRGCKLIAFGAPGELLEQDLGAGAEGLAALLALMDQSFDGGTDVQTPIERAIDLVHQARWRSADLLIVSDGEFGCVPHTLQRLDEARARYGLRVQGVLVGDRETMGLLEVCDAIHWQRNWRRFAAADGGAAAATFSPVHSQSLTALYFPNALSARAARHRGGPR